jgi:hypothetical protein
MNLMLSDSFLCVNQTPLMLACKNGRVACIEQLIQSGANVSMLWHCIFFSFYMSFSWFFHNHFFVSQLSDPDL